MLIIAIASNYYHHYQMSKREQPVPGESPFLATLMMVFVRFVIIDKVVEFVCQVDSVIAGFLATESCSLLTIPTTSTVKNTFSCLSKKYGCFNGWFMYV